MEGSVGSILTPVGCFASSAVRVINDNGLTWTCKRIKIVIVLAWKRVLFSKHIHIIFCTFMKLSEEI